VLCTEDPGRADLYRRLRELQRLLRDRGDRTSWPTLDDARDHPFTDEQLARIRSRRSRQIIGTPDEVRTDLERLAEATGAQELTILTHAQTFDERVESYRLLARTFGLEPPH
jgi:alkanesulfonate monooxygenase SsuD/methylene tetrahydromethanopterin reductase-like flavin-dependent oxidoreductase (luciferase family)